MLDVVYVSTCDSGALQLKRIKNLTPPPTIEDLMDRIQKKKAEIKSK